MRRARPLAPALLVLVALAAAPTHGEPSDDASVLPLSSRLRVVVQDGRQLELGVLAGGRDTYASIADRVCSGPGDGPALAEWNRGRALAKGDWVRVPLSLLYPRFRSLVLRRTFPEDYLDGGDWIHVARSGPLAVYDQGMWQVATWFARDEGQAFARLMRINDLDSPELSIGQRIRIPGDLLHPAFHSREHSDDDTLEYGTDEDGPYAAYRLKAGEALYSAVVLRFTGRTDADDVRQLAELVARRSAIPDPRDIPVGYEIRIPLNLLEPDHLPSGHPRRQEAEAQRAELERVLDRQPVRGSHGGLDDVVIIIDPGHGGRDLGTQHNGIWEHDYVYDVACRLKEQFEADSRAVVHMTLLDMETGCKPSKKDRLVANHQGSVLTTPRFLAKHEGEARIGVNLRWYLSNSIYRNAVKAGIDPDRIVFLSLHADARHPSLRGVMVYVPGANYRTRTYGHSGGVYPNYQEVRAKTHVKFSRTDRLRSEAVSRKLADAIVREFRRDKLPVQPHQPVRDKIIRGQQRYLPAVLRSNQVPTKVLVEMLNLSNREDARLLGSAEVRERLARAVFLALHDFFGEKPVSSSGARAAAD